MLSVQSLQFAYGEHTVLKGINLELETGKIHGIAGLNGSGKTTLLQLIYGLLSPDSGEVQFQGQPVSKNITSFLEASNYFYHRLTTRETLELFAIGNTGFDAAPWLNLFSLTGEEFTEDLSTGMRKKLAILAVLAQHKTLLLLDEPFNGLDLESVMVFNLILGELRKQGKTILITSHILDTLIDNCDTIHTCSDGVILQSYTPEEYGKMKQDFITQVQGQVKHDLETVFGSGAVR